MRITKEEARQLDLFPFGTICPFHENNPDQQAIMDSCKECYYIQDDCGCSYDEECESCCLGEKQ